MIITPNQLVAGSLVIQFWIPREKVNPGVFVAIFLVIILSINYFGGIRFFGEFEFWLSSFKVVVIVGLILFSLIIAAGGGPNGDAPGFRYWSDPGAFAPLYATGALGKFIGFWSVMVFSTYAFLGIELVAVTSAEAQNPRRSIPKAIKLTFYRILIFYVLSVFLIGLCVPYNSPELAFANKSNTSASASPFVVAAKLAGVQILPHIINSSVPSSLHSPTVPVANGSSFYSLFCLLATPIYIFAAVLSTGWRVPAQPPQSSGEPTRTACRFRHSSPARPWLAWPLWWFPTTPKRCLAILST